MSLFKATVLQTANSFYMKYKRQPPWSGRFPGVRSAAPAAPADPAAPSRPNLRQLMSC